ncbi:hypothetical protein TWF506_010042 [Arthrobotrys conoides]|uniref:Uncharacterized protein n=1 Tax=Arthrobotrys conoides TaxID=74498 RepID=A0AAN8NCK7_9PEZI
MYLSFIALSVGLILPNLIIPVSSESVNINAKDFARFVQKNEAYFTTLYKGLKKGMHIASWPGIFESIFPLDNDFDDNEATERLKEMYQGVKHQKEFVEKLLAGGSKPGGKPQSPYNVTPRTPEMLADIMVWVDSITTQEIRVRDRVWQGYGAGDVDKPVFTILKDLYEELGIDYRFKRYRNPLVLARWLYAFRPFDEPDDEVAEELAILVDQASGKGEATGGNDEISDEVEAMRRDIEPDTTTIDNDSLRSKLLAISDLATTIKDMIFRGGNLVDKVRDIGGPLPTPGYVIGLHFEDVSKILREWVEALEAIKEALREIYKLDLEI